MSNKPIDKIRINYTYPTIIRQIMYITIMIYVVLHCAVITETLIFKVDGYYGNIMPLPTYLIYAFFIALVACLFMAHKFCYSEFDHETLTSYNRLLRTKKTLDLTQVKFAVFDTFGVKFYDKTRVDMEHDKPIFKLPFWRMGFIDSRDLDYLYQMLCQRGDVGVVKTYKVLLGYSNPWKLLILPYSILTFSFMMNCVTHVTAFLVLLQSHAF